MSNRTGVETGAPAAAAAVRLALSYQVSHALYVATRLGIWDLLAAEVCTISEIASRAGTHVQSTQRLLRALAAFDLVRDVGAGRFELTLVGQCLTSNSTSSVRPLVLMYGSEHARQMFGHLEQCIATGRSAFEIAFGAESGFSYLQGRPDLAQVFNEGMSAASRFTGAAIIKSYDFDGVCQVIDVGGGHGEVLAAILHAYPHLRAILFELPSVIQGASGKIAGADLRGRCALVDGDMFSAVPSGGDLYLLVHILHNWDDKAATAVLKSCRQAMSDAGKLLILDRVMPERVEPTETARRNALIDLMMLVRTPGGRERTADEFAGLLASAGLQLQRITPLDISEALIEATPL
ncbi:methyltransferase [Bradyrhizobium sp. JYMT SZCCT0428]|uniref:methyltransferase n=1 Tax=Bradyrhizobium sp. JYMT SZCCT0428 TaxID=2807673 RepID=UPI001BAB4E4D|nr:methyltransferase [Bradyrhizobium sp. JYMT SZCCT0428]MBR1154022.1 methyltransferase [Bradyrhizobium sp. JYMT SZCCT0428]